MKADLASTFPPLASHPAPAEPPIVVSEPPPPVHHVTSQLHDFHLARDLALFGRVLRHAPGGRRAMLIFAATIVVTIGNMVGQVWLNQWNGSFFDALAR